jgi:ribosomal protein L12E/L44/L45/RPP1/RPP2/ankyrin repeat protein
LAVVGGNDSPSADDISRILFSVYANADQEEVSQFVREMHGKNILEIMQEGTSTLLSYEQHTETTINATKFNELIQEFESVKDYSSDSSEEDISWSDEEDKKGIGLYSAALKKGLTEVCLYMIDHRLSPENMVGALESAVYSGNFTIAKAVINRCISENLTWLVDRAACRHNTPYELLVLLVTNLHFNGNQVLSSIVSLTRNFWKWDEIARDVSVLEAKMRAYHLLRTYFKLQESDYPDAKLLEIQYAVKHNDEEYIEDILRRGASPDDVIRIAVRGHDHIHIVRAMLEKGGSINLIMKDRPPISIFSHDLTPISLFLDWCTDCKSDCESYIKQLTELLDLGADPNHGAPNQLLNAVNSNLPLSFISQLVQAGTNMDTDIASIMSTAMNRTDGIDVVKMLLDNGADVNASSCISILVRAVRKHHAIADLLLERGADRNTTVTISSITYTPIGYFVYYGNEDSVCYLLQKGFDPNYCPEKCQHVLVIALNDDNRISKGICMTLIAAGANIQPALEGINEDLKQQIIEWNTIGDYARITDELVYHWTKKRVSKFHQELSQQQFSYKSYNSYLKGDLVAVREFIKCGVDPHEIIMLSNYSRGSIYCHPFIAAVRSGNLELIRYLLDDCQVDPVKTKHHVIEDGKRNKLNDITNGVIAILCLDLNKYRSLIEETLVKLQKESMINVPAATHTNDRPSFCETRKQRELERL